MSNSGVNLAIAALVCPGSKKRKSQMKKPQKQGKKHFFTQWFILDRGGCIDQNSVDD